MNNSSINNTNLTGPNHLKIIPSSGVIYKNSKNSKTGNDIYKSKKGRMSYKEYVMLRKKYMEPNVNDTSKENGIIDIIHESKEIEIICPFVKRKLFKKQFKRKIF